MSFQTVTMTLLDGFLLNIELFAVTLVLSLPLGLVVSFGTMSRFKPLSLLVRLYVYIMRSTPLMLQLAVVFYLPGIVFGPGHSLGRMGAAVLAFVLNYAAYFSEIFRGGIQSISQGQMRAGLSLGMIYGQTMRYIVLPQAFKRIIPPLGNEFIAMLKDSSLVSVIGFEELTRSGQLVIAETYATMEIWAAVALLYLIMTLSISQLVSFVERRYRLSDER